MAENPEQQVKSTFGFLSRKVGPVPLWVWMAAGIGVWWYIEKKNTASSAASTASTGMVTDPAGNQCAASDIDGLTGYCTGTSEDLAALAQQNAAASSAGSSGTGSGSSGTGTGASGQTFANNQAWGTAAENYLVSTGIDPTDASNAITSYLGGQALTTQQQADVNLAISILGSPPTLPGPAPTGTTVPPGTTPATGSCPSGYTFSAAQTGAPGEIAATGGTGWCEAGPATTPPPQNAATVTVPDVAGQTAGAAHNTLVAAGLKPTAAAKQADTAIVTGTVPAAGTAVAKGASVEIIAASGATQSGVKVPSVVGMTAGSAHNAIVAAGLVPKAPSGQKAGDKVTSQSPGAGQVTSKGSAVEIYTSGEKT